MLEITDANKPLKQQTALYYQVPGDAIIMSGDFNLKFWHGVPPADSWQALFQRQNIVRKLPPNESEEAIRVIKGEMNERFNVTIRWHESHFDGCPYLCGTAAQIAVPQAPARTIHGDLDDCKAPCLPGSAPVRKMPEMAAVTKIVGPVQPPSPPPSPPPVAKSDAAMEPKVPPEKPQSDQPSSSSSACAEPNEKAVETHRVDTEQATVTKAALFRLFADVTSGVPDWTDCCAALPLLPSRASQKRDYDVLKSLRGEHTRYVHLLTSIKECYSDEAAEKKDLAAARQTLTLLDSRLDIYTSVLQHVAQAAFNEIRLATDHTSKHVPHVVRMIVTFK